MAASNPLTGGEGTTTTHHDGSHVDPHHHHPSTTNGKKQDVDVDDDDDLHLVRALVRTVPDFPLPGILFRDMFPVLKSPEATQALVNHLVHHLQGLRCPLHVIVGIDARGFLLGPMVAQALHAAFVPVRKKGKLPGKVREATYMKEYGTDVLEMHDDAIVPGQNAVILDDLIATGGSARAAGQLVRSMGGNVVEYLFVIELKDLKGRGMLDAPTYAALQY